MNCKTLLLYYLTADIVALIKAKFTKRLNALFLMVKNQYV